MTVSIAVMTGSHNEVEDADPRHLAAGANVLLGAMLSQET